jgi:ADP-ribose pyrophosphatase YjhB (NUDIX family)
MIISANSIVINQFGDVLLVRRDDTRTLAPPGGSCEIDEFPIDAAVRETQEETGLTTFPIRLTGLYFLPSTPDPFLFFCYRCLPRGGELTNSIETPQAGFFKASPLTGQILSFHREQVRQAYTHRGGPPYWITHQIGFTMRMGLFFLNRMVYPWLEFQRSRKGLPQYVPPPRWQVLARLILRDSKGRVLLTEQESSNSWGLPSSDASATEPPWVKANDVNQETLVNTAVLEDLSGIYLIRGRPEMEFVFSGTMRDDFQPQTGHSTYFETDSFPTNLEPEHRSMIEDLLDPSELISYKLFD